MLHQLSYYTIIAITTATTTTTTMIIYYKLILALLGLLTGITITNTIAISTASATVLLS